MDALLAYCALNGLAWYRVRRSAAPILVLRRPGYMTGMVWGEWPHSSKPRWRLMTGSLTLLAERMVETALDEIPADALAALTLEEVQILSQYEEKSYG